MSTGGNTVSTWRTCIPLISTVPTQKQDSDVIMEYRNRSCNVSRVFYVYLKGIKLGWLTPLWRMKICGSFIFPFSREFHGIFFARVCENGISTHAMKCTSGMHYINVARERRVFKGSRKCTESDKNTKTFSRTHSSCLYCCCWQLIVSVFFIYGEQLFKRDYVKDWLYCRSKNVLI